VITVIRCLVVGVVSTFVVLVSAGYLEPFSTRVTQSAPYFGAPPIQNAPMDDMDPNMPGMDMSGRTANVQSFR
jgi:hypothetical protein